MPVRDAIGEFHRHDQYDDGGHEEKSFEEHARSNRAYNCRRKQSAASLASIVKLSSENDSERERRDVAELLLALVRRPKSISNSANAVTRPPNSKPMKLIEFIKSFLRDRRRRRSWRRTTIACVGFTACTIGATLHLIFSVNKPGKLRTPAASRPSSTKGSLRRCPRASCTRSQCSGIGPCTMLRIARSI